MDISIEQNRSYYVNFRQFSTGAIEVVTKLVRPMQMEQAKRRYESHGALSAFPHEKTDEEARANWNRAVRRAKQSIRWLCKQMAADRLLTLTYRENIQDREHVRSQFREFLRLVRKQYPGWRYVAVLELQDRGAYHIHCAVQGWQRISYLRECWYRALGGTGKEIGDQTPGAVNVTSPNRRWGSKGLTWKTQQLASYITKYLSKTFDETSAEKRRYWSAKDVKVPVKERVWLGSQNIIDAIKETVGVAQLFYGLRADYDMWLSPDTTTFWLSGLTDY